jgi:DNA-binding NtrC family response regulator
MGSEHREPMITRSLPTLSESSHRLSQHEIQLGVTAGPDQGITKRLLASRVSIGTAATNDLRLTDDTVSRHHCEIVVRDGTYVVRDLGSTNGTCVDGVRVYEAILEAGMTLALGDSHVRFESQHRWVEVGQSEVDHFGDLYGTTPSMRTVFALLERVAPVGLTCLIVGETGTGKEVAARGVHDASDRAGKPFVTFDCGAVTANLVEAKLFGHERGAFTGADKSRAGSFEAANGGTIFLDEIGELPLEVQPKLLRVLERREVTRIGATHPVGVDVRVLAATHRDLSSMVEEGTFREDLLYRLAEVVVRLPPLREHREDIPLLASRILGQMGGPARSLSPAALAYLQAQTWPGNVRELRNTIRRAAALSRAAVIERSLLASLDQVRPSSLPPALVGQAAGEGGVDGLDELSLRDAKRVAERDYLIRLVARFGSDLDSAARHAGVHPKSLARLLRQHSLGRT